MTTSFVIKSRIAPTPSGYLHWGNLLNFTLAWVHTRRQKGILQLRIDDLDAERSRPEYVDDIFQSLEWLGFDWDEGPSSPDDFRRHHSQAAQKEKYREWLSRFPGYGCDCSRKLIQKRTDALYDGMCRERGLPLVQGTTLWRMREEHPCDDIVLWRKEDMPSYHLVSIIEDLSFESNFIVRGEDLFESTQAQLRIARMLGSDGASFSNAHFLHHPLIKDARGMKLSKSAGSTSLKYYREQGCTSSEAFVELSKLTGWPQPITSLQDALCNHNIMKSETSPI